MNKIHINERVRELLLDGEKSFSPFAKKSNETLGRRFPITPDILRLEFSRDENRILHSLAFRRLKHKAQVFLSPVNDHVCTRIEHVLYVASISSTIGRGLSLNNDLIRAISIGHDIGHSPFGHVGEQALDEALKNRGYINGFKHEIHGLRVVDRAANFGEGLNLTYEVRDGILNHCGESYDRVLQPDREKDLTKLHEITNRDFLPSTLEGCLVRMVDRISYLGRDLEDALKNGMVKKRTIPKEIKEKIGTNNGNIIGYFVSDIIMNSVGEDKIELSEEAFDLMMILRNFNYNEIYHNDFENKKSKRAKIVIEHLFKEFEDALIYSDNGHDKKAVERLKQNIPIMNSFFKFINDMKYSPKTTTLRIITDYIAGMTDCFAEQTFKSLFLPETF